MHLKDTQRNKEKRKKEKYLQTSLDQILSLLFLRFRAVCKAAFSDNPTKRDKATAGICYKSFLNKSLVEKRVQING